VSVTNLTLAPAEWAAAAAARLLPADVRKQFGPEKVAAARDESIVGLDLML
jgi:hypothetical protein